MRKFLQLLFQNMGLPVFLGLSVLLLSIFGRVGRTTIYEPYLPQLGGYPSMLLVIEGIRDGVYPWDLWAYGKEPAEETEEESVPVQEEEPVPEEESAQTADASQAGQETETQESVGGDSEANALVRDNSFEGPVEGPLPDGVCNPVMQAEDYEVANLRFLSNAETEYNTDTEGLFARNGRYFRLRAVDSSYFGDALFIGDSRTVGLCEYGSLKGKTSFLAKESVNVYNVLDKELRYTTPDGESEDAYMEEVLEEGSFRKIYLCLGVNELGIGTTYMYYEKYRELLEMIHEYQPEAIIYIEGIMHVSEYYSRRDSARNNTVIVQRNEAIATLANGWNIFYIDMNPYVCTDNGNLDGSLSGDGIHLKASAYEFWDKSLFENAIVRDAEDYSGQENPVFEEYVQETAEEEEETEESGGEGE